MSSEARDRGGIFGDASRFLATETVLSRVSGSKAAEASLAPKPREDKDYSGGTAKPDLRRTAWWSWQDSNLQPTGYGYHSICCTISNLGGRLSERQPEHLMLARPRDGRIE
jgi:hypothetical protein